MLNRKILAVLLAGIVGTSLGIAYFTGAFSALIGGHSPTTTTTPQSPLLSGEYTGSEQVKEPCNSYFPCGYQDFCRPGAPCQNNFTITNRGSQSVILSGYKFPDGQGGRLWQSVTAGENFTLSLWDPAGYQSASITLTTSDGFTVRVGTIPPQSIIVSEGHGFQDSYHVSVTLIVQSNSSTPSPVNFTSYSVQDGAGYLYTNSSWAYTVMPFPPSVNVTSIGVVDGYGPGVGSVNLYYSPEFATGSNYTIALTTSAYGSFSFRVTGGMFQAVITYRIQNLIVLEGVNATGSMLSTHFSVVGSSVSFYQVQVYDGNTVIGIYTCPSGGTSCTYSGSSWITVSLSTPVNTIHTYWIAFSFTGDAPGYYVKF